MLSLLLEVGPCPIRIKLTRCGVAELVLRQPSAKPVSLLRRRLYNIKTGLCIVWLVFHGLRAQVLSRAQFLLIVGVLTLHVHSSFLVEAGGTGEALRIYVEAHLALAAPVELAKAVV